MKSLWRVSFYANVILASVAILLLGTFAWLTERWITAGLATELHEFTATAYCVQATTRAGVRVQQGMVAADPDVLPLGSILRIETPRSHAGIYSVLDTGGRIIGTIIDVYMRSCNDATEFGRQPVTFRILRLGWDPRASGPSDEPGERLGARTGAAESQPLGL